MRPNVGLGQQVSVEAPPCARTVDPDVAGAQPVAQDRDDGRLVEAAVDLAALLAFLPDEAFPRPRRERHRSVRGHVPSSGPVQLAQQCYPGEQRLAAGARPQLDAVDEDRREPTQGGVLLARGGERIRPGQLGERIDLGLRLQEPPPADRLVEELEGVGVPLARRLERGDRPAEQPHQPAHVTGRRLVASLPTALALGEQRAHQLVEQVDRGVGQAGLELQDLSGKDRSPSELAEPVDHVGRRHGTLPDELAEAALMDGGGERGIESYRPHVIEPGEHGDQARRRHGFRDGAQPSQA